MNLYEIKNSVDELLSLEDFNEETIAKLDGLKEDATDKLENIAKYIRNLEASAKAFEEEEKHFANKKKQAKNKIESLKKYTSSFLDAIGKDKFEAGNFKYSFRKTSSVNILDEEKISEDYKQIKTEIKIDKIAISNAIKEGKKVEGAEILEGKSIQIK